jgi:hypothetical protein
LQRGERADFGRRFFERVPNSSEILRADLRIGGDGRQRLIGHAERRAMLVTPRGMQIVGDVRWLPAVEIDNPQNAVFVAVRVRYHRVRGEGKAARQQH